MDGKLPDALGRLYAQLKQALDNDRTELEDRSQMVRLADEIESIATMLEAANAPNIGPIGRIEAYRLGPRPTHCELCGQPIRSAP
ncbi:hypothetical protein E2976_15150 [Paracoccus yeei]|uniref:hypothetical protein n=1 Tax=Paracoccus yeei TaxID=147645 RepID=UPI003BF89320